MSDRQCFLINLFNNNIKLKIKYKFSIAIVKSDFLAVWWFSTEQNNVKNSL